MTYQSARGTGRTTRMVHAAMEKAREGRAVYVICASAAQASVFMQRYPGALRLGVKFETWASIGSFDTEDWRAPGAHRNCVFLADHHAIETRYARLLDELHAYDAPLAPMEMTEEDLAALTEPGHITRVTAQAWGLDCEDMDDRFLAKVKPGMTTDDAQDTFDKFCDDNNLYSDECRRIAALAWRAALKFANAWTAATGGVKP